MPKVIDTVGNLDIYIYVKTSEASFSHILFDTCWHLCGYFYIHAIIRDGPRMIVNKGGLTSFTHQPARGTLEHQYSNNYNSLGFVPQIPLIHLETNQSPTANFWVIELYPVRDLLKQSQTPSFCGICPSNIHPVYIYIPSELRCSLVFNVLN